MRAVLGDRPQILNETIDRRLKLTAVSPVFIHPAGEFGNAPCGGASVTRKVQWET